MKHIPRKRFGQNFLQDGAIIQNIVQALHLRQNDKVIEIGPGLGALTIPLLKRLTELKAVEIDRDLQSHLEALPLGSGKLEVIAADALTVDFSQWGNELRLVGNLPYNLSTPLLFHFLSFVSSLKDLHFMLQKEVVDRLAAEPGSKAYGRLTVMVQYLCEVESLFIVPPQAFYPQPKVYSAVVRLTPYHESPYPKVELELLSRLVAQAFSMRRKTLANNLKPLLSSEQLLAAGIEPQKRPEQISVREYVQLTHFLTHENLMKNSQVLGG